jgi:hypothetical protein
MTFQPRNNPILGIALGLSIAGACVSAFGDSRRLLVFTISLLAAAFAFASFFFKPSAHQSGQ